MADKIPAALLPTITEEQAASMPSQLGDTPIVSTEGNVSGDLMSLYDHKNGAILAVPPDEAEAYLKSGQFSLPKKTRINVVDQNGEVASIDSAEAYDALQSGYRLETQAEQSERKLQEQYGGLGEQVVGGIEAVARGVSLGASDQLLVNSGDATPEALAGRQAANPISSTIAEVAGLIGSPINKVLPGAAVERQVAKAAMKAGVSSPIARSIATKIVPAAAGSAVEGAFFGAGQLLSEDALGKADLNAENLAAYIGTGALLNGAFGAAFKGASELAGPASKMAKFVTSPFTSKISQNLDSQVSAGRLLGLTPLQMQKLEARNPKVAEGMQQYLKEDLKMALTDTAEELARKNAAIKEAAGFEIGAVLKEVDEVFERAPLMKPSGASVWDNVYEKVFKQVEDLLEKDIPGMSKHQKPINDFLDDVAKLGKSEEKFNATDLQKFKKGLDKMLKYEKEPGKWTVLEDMAFTARTAVRDEIDKMAKTVEELGGAGDLAQRLKAANRKYGASATFGDFLEKRSLRAADRDFSVTGAIKDAGLDLSRKLVVLGKIEQGRQTVSKAIKKTVKAFETATRGVSIGAQTQVPNIVNSALSVDYSGEKPKKAQTKEQAYNNVLKNINSFTANPTAFMERANRQTASLYSAAPQTSAQLDNLAMTAMTYLSMKVPKRSADMTLLSAYKPVPLPSTQELGKFARIMQAIEKPMDVLKNLENGTASREEMDVLKEIYPATFKELQETFLAELPKLSQTLPYNRRVQMGLLLGVPADASMLPQNVLGLQALFGQQQPGEQGAVNPTVTGMAKLGESNNMQTPLQQAQAGVETE